jgi:hypothetical protein
LTAVLGIAGASTLQVIYAVVAKRKHCSDSVSASA